MRAEMEMLLLGHSAPTLAGLKSASLVRLPEEKGQIDEAVAEWNALLNARGVVVRIAKRDERSALIYLYREKLLLRDWQAPGAAQFLQRHGYDLNQRMEDLLARLFSRIAQHACFPHEIGLFLGYPLEDVQGFINNGGRNYCLCGCWKVYGDADAAQRSFAQYRKCADVYLRCYRNGHTLSRLTVAG